MASEALKATTCLTRFINFCETFQELCCNPTFKDDQRDVKSCKAQLQSHQSVRMLGNTNVW